MATMKKARVLHRKALKPEDADYLISRGMKSMFSDDSARVGTYDTFYGYGTVGTVGTVRWVRYGGYGGTVGTVGAYPPSRTTVPTVPYPLYPPYRIPTVPTVPYPPYPPYRTHCTHRTVPPYPTYRTLHRTFIFEPLHRALLLKFDKMQIFYVEYDDQAEARATISSRPDNYH